MTCDFYARKNHQHNAVVAKWFKALVCKTSICRGFESHRLLLNITMDRFIEKIFEKAIIGGNVQLRENEFGEFLIENGMLLDFKSEVMVFDREDGDYDLHINRKIVPNRSIEEIKIDFNIE